MKVHEIKEFDILYIQRKAAVKLAKHLKVEYCDLMDYVELQKKIKDKDEDLYTMLMDFSSAYWNYYYFSKSLSEQTKDAKIEGKDSEMLKEHIKEKDEKRTILMIEIKKRKKQ